MLFARDVAEDRPIDAYGSGFGAPNACISERKAPLEHTDACLNSASEALKTLEPFGVLLFLFFFG